MRLVDVIGMVMLIIIYIVHIYTYMYIYICTYMYNIVSLGPAKTLENQWIP